MRGSSPAGTSRICAGPVRGALVTAALALTALACGCGNGPLSTQDVREGLESIGPPVRYLKTGYNGPGELTAAEVGQGRAAVRTLVYAGSDARRMEHFAPWPHYRGAGVGFGEGQNDDLYVWTQLTRRAIDSGRLKPSDYALTIDIQNTLCELRLDHEKCSRP